MADIRIDYYPTHEFEGIKFRRGHTLPFGATMVPNGVNFSVYSSAAISCTLVLFERGEAQPYAEIPFPDEFKIGDVYCMTVFDLDYERLEYGYRIDLLVENTVVVELKSVEVLHPVHEAQTLTYMKFSDKKVGLLINFNVLILKNGVRRFMR